MANGDSIVENEAIGTELIDPYRSWLIAERQGHDAFARTRRRAYVEKTETLEALDSYVAEGEWNNMGRSVPLVITGESGGGKSSLLAHWSARYSLDNPDAFVITHFVGATAASNNYHALIRRIMLEIQELLDLQEEPAEDPELMLPQFQEWLSYVQGRPVVLIIDALNQLDERSDRPFDLHWLPLDFPSHVRVLLSTLAGEALDSIRSRNWKELRILPLNQKERREVARRFLGMQGKSVDLEQIRRVAGNRNSANPLYLRTSLEELRLINRQKQPQKLPQAQPEEKIDSYLAAENIEVLFDRVLERIEKAGGVRLVTTMMRYLWGSRYGLKEEELVALTGARQEKIEELIKLLDYQLMRRDGLLTFFHDHLRDAVRARYITSARIEKNLHGQLAEYFASCPIGERRADEELWQWSCAEEWEKLGEGLMNLPLYYYMAGQDRMYDVLRLWQRVPGIQDRTFEEIYQPAIEELLTSREERPVQTADMLESVAILLGSVAENSGAEKLYRQVLEIRKEHQGEDHLAVIQTLTRLGSLLFNAGSYIEAEDVLNRTLEIARSRYGNNHPETARVLHAIGTLYYTIRRYEEGLAIFRQVLSIRERTLGLEHSDTILGRIDVGVMHLMLGQKDLAHNHITRALEECRRILGDEHPMTSMALNNLSYTTDDPVAAHSYVEQAAEINRKIFGNYHPDIATNLSNLASWTEELGRIDEAEALLREAVEIGETVYGPSHISLSAHLGPLCQLLLRKGSDPEILNEAEELAERILAIRLKILPDDHYDVLLAHMQLAVIYRRRGEFERAEPIYRAMIERDMRQKYRREDTRQEWQEKHIQILRALNRNEEADEMARFYQLEEKSDSEE